MEPIHSMEPILLDKCLWDNNPINAIPLGLFNKSYRNLSWTFMSETGFSGNYSQLGTSWTNRDYSICN